MGRGGPAMKLYFLTSKECELAAKNDSMLEGIRADLLSRHGHGEAPDPGSADAIIIHEEFSFKEWRYVPRLIQDPVIGCYPNKVYTINNDDCANGLLRGVYTSLPRCRYNAQYHGLVPYASFPNQAVLERRHEARPEPKYLGTWRGNTKSNRKLRDRFFDVCSKSPKFLVEKTDSWLNHNTDEKNHYVDVMLAGKFSLCPAGWAAVSFRIYESMALGIAPVIIADEFVPPGGPDWSEFSIRFPEEDVSNIEAILEGFSDSYREMGRKARVAWEQYFSPECVTGYYADTLLHCIRAGLNTGSASKEIARWRSFHTYWTNSWTIPQRIMIKLDALGRR